MPRFITRLLDVLPEHVTQSQTSYSCATVHVHFQNALTLSNSNDQKGTRYKLKVIQNSLLTFEC